MKQKLFSSEAMISVVTFYLHFVHLRKSEDVGEKEAASHPPLHNIPSE